MCDSGRKRPHFGESADGPFKGSLPAAHAHKF